jgi:hypothetical protein
MIIEDIKELEKIKKEIAEGNANKRIVRRFKRIQKKYECVIPNDTTYVSAFYLDKFGNIVAVLTSGKVINYKKSTFSTGYTSFMFAFFILAILLIPSHLIVNSYFPEHKNIIDNYSSVVSLLSATYAIIILVKTWKTTVSSLPLLTFNVLAILLNIFIFLLRFM